VANASMYDGASAAAEAVLTSITATNRKKVIVSGALNPAHTEVIRTYARGFEGEISILLFGGGVSDLNRLEDAADSNTACFVVSHPNFFGALEDVERAANIIHQVGGLMIVAADPISLALLKPPGEMGADIVVGEGQPLGIPVSFGGPLLGLYATKKSLIRRLPGRLVARTVDAEGKPGFTLTLQTREQHIRRAKATSNICTNEALCATAATVFLSLMGKQGLRRVADIALERAHYAADKISALDGYSLAFEAPFHREFVIRTPIPASEIIKKLSSHGILAGIDLARFYPEMKNRLLIAVTEKRTYEEVDHLVESFRELYVNRDEPIEVVG
ncbi:MAG: aminomethyl-transferring glycine dehydrogenase subunit GcvPA, partial [candidate division Zixibacteria bacterium]|nr:aminomethyl-transferring glycine dehydrogenase subunit GcvPA [candidate division Zixibacteria bacterium]